jgi:hypothetical protein
MFLKSNGLHKQAKVVYDEVTRYLHGKWEVGSGKWEVGSGKWEVSHFHSLLLRR